MAAILLPLIHAIFIAINLYWWAIVIYVLLGWLEQLSVISRDNNIISGVLAFLSRIIEPALVPIRRLLPRLGGVDLSPLVLILGIYLVQDIILLLILKVMGTPNW